jgi:hypothetical protein
LEALMLYEDLVTLLSGATAAATRVYPQVADATPARPYIIYSRISSNSENVMSGSTGLFNTRLQIDVYADTYVAVQALAAEVAALMDGWDKQNVSYPQIDQYEAETRLHRVILDYSIWHY